jgi:hypothetical protein
MKRFCYTVDDNIRFLKEINEKRPKSIFDHPYLNMYKRMHEKYGLKIQLNLFYECENFTLSDMTADYVSEWKQASDWLKLSFHSRLENVRPYVNSDYNEVFTDTSLVNAEIERFASKSALAKSTTIHYCRATEEGISALKDNGIVGLLGLYGNKEKPSTSYTSSEEDSLRISNGETLVRDGIAYSGIDLILNSYEKSDGFAILKTFLDRDLVKIMIHEQYFYSDYARYQPDFEEKIGGAFDILTKSGYKSVFFEECI